MLARCEGIAVGFPENVLARDEKVVRSLHPHGWTILGPVLIGVILLAAGIAVARFTGPDQDVMQWIVVGVLAILAVPLVLVPMLSWRTTHYVITTHRVMIRQGILSKSGKDITLSKITDVSFEQSVLDRLINSGTLRVESAGDSPNEMFRNIPKSNEVQQVINRLIDEDANRRSALIHERIRRADGVFDQDRDERRAAPAPVEGVGPAGDGEPVPGMPGSDGDGRAATGAHSSLETPTPGASGSLSSASGGTPTEPESRPRTD